MRLSYRHLCRHVTIGAKNKKYMKESKDHLNIDLEFLDKKESVRVASKPDEQAPDMPKSSSVNRKYNWKNILIIGGVVLFFGWAIFSGASDSSSNSYTPTSSGTQLFSEGDRTFSCTNSNYDRAIQLRPNASTNTQLATELDSLNTRIEANEADEAELDGMHVDEGDQYALDDYNSRVDDYNAKREILLSDLTDWKQRHDAFSNQIDVYNNFLDSNCTQ